MGSCGDSEVVMIDMLDYIQAVKRQFRDVYGFLPKEDYGDEVIFAEGQIPDGEYPMTIDGRLDKVRITKGTIYCCNFEDLR
jgi:hypothetical protein